MRGRGFLLVVLGLLAAPAVQARDCEDIFKSFHAGNPQRPPAIVADSKWHSYLDTLNGFSFHLKIYRGFESKSLDSAGAVVVGFPSPTGAKQKSDHRFTREFMITSITETKTGYRLRLLDSPQKRPREWVDVKLGLADRLIDRASRDVMLDIRVDAKHRGLKRTAPVQSLKLYWDRHPFVPVYRDREEFYRGFLHQESD